MQDLGSLLDNDRVVAIHGSCCLENVNDVFKNILSSNNLQM